VRLIIDTATRTPILALADAEGGIDHERRWPSEHRHGEQLLEKLNEMLAAADAVPRDIDGVIVGLGPGSFTGLRIGLATAKVIAYTLDVPLVGVSTTEALGQAVAAREGLSSVVAVTLPAGVADRYVHRLGVDDSDESVHSETPPQLVVPGAGFDEAIAGAFLVAVDLAGASDISDDAIERGQTALEGLARALATLGARRLDRGERDDVALLTPAYVALPRGIAQAAVDMAWSPDLR
jgi:tRNA threonylcarbamoyladenosine biosynthesis protein TsaB